MKKKKVNEWKKTSIKHALWRAKDRGINIGKGELDEIVHNILYEGLEPVREESIHRKVYKAKDRDGEVYFFVFDSRMNCVVTVFKETKYNFSKKSDSIRTKAEEREYKRSTNYAKDWING